jgi:hypothetical protein
MVKYFVVFMAAAGARYNSTFINTDADGTTSDDTRLNPSCKKRNGISL